MEKLNVAFYPWVGKKYASEGFNGKKVMILGESHYGYQDYDPNDEEKKKATIDTVEKYLGRQKFTKKKNQWISTYTKLTKICLGVEEITQEEKENFWDSILFYNYLTVSLSKPRERPNEVQWKNSEGDFFKVLESYIPDIILIVGAQLWNNKPQRNWILTETNKNLGYYSINGKKIFASSIYHPVSFFQYGTEEYDSRNIFKDLILASGNHKTDN